MTNNYRRYCLTEIINELNSLDSTEVEEMGHIILEDICQKSLLLRGHTVEGESVGYTLDSYSRDAKIVGEYSRQKNYFEKGAKFKKIIGDIRHSITLAPQVEKIYLFSNQTMGPSVGMSLAKLCNRMERFVNRSVEIYDARSIAEYIVDNLFIKEIVVNKIEEYLPLLRKLRDMQTITNALPAVERNYISRTNEEERIINKLSEANYLLVTGISGIGKTSSLISVCHSIKQDYDIIVWLDGKDVNIDNLNSVSISRLGINQNLIGLLRMHKTLVVIDSLENDTANIIRVLAEACREGSKVLATAQIADASVNLCTVEFMTNDESKSILNHCLTIECPQNTFNKIIESVGGHPLVLSLINASIGLEEQTWLDVEEDIRHLPQYEDNKSRKICDRIIEKHIATIGRELSAIKWLNTSIIDRGVLKSMVGKAGIVKLEKRSLTMMHITNGIKIHDIVFNSISHGNIDGNDFSNEFFEFFKCHVEQKNSIFFKALYTHKEKIISILNEKPELGIMLYCYLHMIQLGELNEELISQIKYDNFLSPGYVYKPDDYYAIISLVELFEVERRERNFINGKYPTELGEDRLRKIKACSEIAGIPENVKIEIIHHLGKFYKQALDNKEEAIACFNEALKNPKTEFAAQLQLSRLMRKSDIEESKEYLRNIFDAYKTDKNLISPTTVLGAFEDLKVREYEDLRVQYLYETSLLEDALFLNYHENFDQPFRVVASLSRHLTYKYPERIKAIIQQMPIPSEESISSELAFVAGELYKEFGKSFIWDGSENISKTFSACDQASAYYSKVTRRVAYQDIKIAENYILLSKEKEANEILMQVPEEKREAFWYYRHAQALALDNFFINDALLAINLALDKLQDSRFKSAFRYEKAKILRKIGDPSSVDEYKAAYQLADTDKFKEDILNECTQVGISF